MRRPKPTAQTTRLLSLIRAGRITPRKAESLILAAGRREWKVVEARMIAAAEGRRR